LYQVPIDVPGVAFEMMNNFLYGKSFQGSLQVLKQSKGSDCPACQACNASEYDEPNANDSSHGSSSISPALASGLVFGLMVVIAVFWRRRLAVDHAPAPQYDLEMRESHFSDQPVD
jgi:hypothetical protein